MTDRAGPRSPDAISLAEEAAGWRSAYVHVPFCRRRCPYCDFAVVTPDEMPKRRSIDEYVAALLREIGMEPPWQPLHAVNLGGGTPSTLPPSDIARIIEALRGRFGILDDAEISIEANPEDITPESAEALAAAGVDRVSLGIQSFDDEVLATLGRLHDGAGAAAAVGACRAAGFRSVSVDLIYGSAVESPASWERTVRRALDLEPDHLSAYALTVELGTELSRSVRAGAPAPDPDRQADMYEIVVRSAREAGLVHYEISNFAMAGHHCRYNLATWAQGDYVAFGLGAHGHRAGMRRRNVRRLDRYLEMVSAGTRPQAGADLVAGWAREQERLLLGLRRRAGVVAGSGGEQLLASSHGQRLVTAGVMGLTGDRLVVHRPLLTDEVNRSVLSLTPPNRFVDAGDLSVSARDC